MSETLMSCEEKAVEIESKLGKYLLLDELGRGAMGVVHRGYDPLLERPVAIKVMKGSDLSERRRARFRFEAKAIAKLQHPNIVAIHELGETDDHVPYIVMELLKGNDLGHRLEHGLPSIEESLTIVGQVCRGLEHAHQRNVVHRDIKPGNVFLGDEGVVKVTDFGIALLSQSETTTPGKLVGTAAYMSPEQVRGDGVDGRSDIFSVGIILFELLTGKRPFFGEHLEATLHQVAHQAVEKVEFPDGRPRPELERLVLRALAKTANERYQHASEMVHEIEDWLKIHAREEVEIGEDPSQSAPPPMAPDDALSYLIEHTRTEKDFPILRQSAVSLMQLPDSGSVIDAADIVLQDQALTANILRVANSVYFNRSDRKIDSVSRAITILGLDLVRNTCLGLGYAEAHDKRHPEVEIRKLSAKAFFAATLARELAVAKRHRNPEEVFTGALLHNLPHMALAYLLPEVHLYVQRLLEEGKASPDEAERRALTVPLTKVGISMAVQWHLPNVLLEAIGADESHTTTAARSPTAVTRVAAFLANAIAANILSEASPTDELEKLLDGLDRSLGLVRETAISIIQQAHQRAIKFGQSFGIDWKSFEPTARASVDSERDTDTLRDGLVCALQQQLDTTPDG